MSGRSGKLFLKESKREVWPLVLGFSIWRLQIAEHGEMLFIQCDQTQPVQVGGRRDEAIREPASMRRAELTGKEASPLCDLGCARKGRHR